MRDPLRVCHLASGDGWGGLEALVLSLARAQSQDPGYDVHLIVLNEGRLAREAAAAGVRIHMLPESSMSAWQLGRSLHALLKSLRPQLLHTHRYKENLLSYLVAPSLGIRSVVTLHGYEPSPAWFTRFKVGIRDFISLRLARRARAQFAAVSRDLQRLYHLRDDECITIQNGIALPAKAPPRATADRRERAPVIGWVGRLVPIKSVGTLLDAVTRMGGSRLQPTVLLVGDGPERAALAEQVERLGLQAHVQFAGQVDDLKPHFARMDVFALPSLHEGVPLALLEAMAAGIPGVAARVGGIPEMIGDSGAARLVEGHDPATWANVLEDVLANPKAAAEMAERARQLVAERFSVEAMHGRYGAWYRAVLAD